MVVSSNVIYNLPRKCKVLCDLRFFDPEFGTYSVNPLRFPEIDNFLVGNRQYKITDDDNDCTRDYFCVPLLSTDVVWDPSIRLILDTWIRSMRQEAPLAIATRVVLCSCRDDAEFYAGLFRLLDIDNTEIVDCTARNALDNIVAKMLLAIRDNNARVDIIDALRGYDWLGSLADEIAAMSEERITVIPVLRFLERRVRPDSTEFSSETRLRFSSVSTDIFWELDKRLERRYK
jgi:hypothetical protein